MQVEHLLRGGHGLELRDRFAPALVDQDLAFDFQRDMSQRETDPEAVELGFGEGIGAVVFQRVLRGDAEERRGEGPGLAIDGDLSLGHCLEQSRLGAGRGAVDFVGDQHIGEDGPGIEPERPQLRIGERGPQDVAGEQVGSELYALEPATERGGERLGERGLARPGNVLDERMPTRQEAADQQFQRGPLPLDDPLEIGQQRRQDRRGGGRRGVVTGG